MSNAVIKWACPGSSPGAQYHTDWWLGRPIREALIWANVCIGGVVGSYPNGPRDVWFGLPQLMS